MEDILKNVFRFMYIFGTIMTIGMLFKHDLAFLAGFIGYMMIYAYPYLNEGFFE